MDAITGDGKKKGADPVGGSSIASNTQLEKRALTAEPLVVSQDATGVETSSKDELALKPSLPRMRYFILAASLGLGFFLAVLDSSIVATSLYSIAIEFQEIGDINWVALSYTLSYLSCAVLFARISDVIGRRAAYLSAYVIFVGFSLACGWAQSLKQLIAFRALQGIGGSGLYSLTMILFPEMTPDKYQKYVAGIIGLVLALSAVLGPLLGGILTQYASWRWVFWINGPVGGASVLLLTFTWPNQKYFPHFERRNWKEVDFVGSFLLVAAASLIVFPFQNSSEGDQWAAAAFLAPLIAGIACLAGLFAWQYFIELRWSGKFAAALPAVLMRNRVYVAVVLNTMLNGFPYLMAIFVFPIRFQVVNGKSAVHAGLMLLPMLAATAIGSFLAGVINGGKKNYLAETLVVSSLLMLIGCAAETVASSDAEYEPKVLGFLAFIGFGFGLSATASTMLGIVESPVRELATGQGIIAQVRIFGGSLGIAASSAILGVKMRSELAGIVSPEELTRSGSGISGLSSVQQAAVRNAYTKALHNDMIVCSAVLAVSALCAVAVYRKDRLSIQEMQDRRRQEEVDRRTAAKMAPSAPVAKGEV